MKSKSTLPILNAAIALCLTALVGFTAKTFAQAQSTAPATSITAAKKTIQAAQERLQALGYQPGVADGMMGSKAVAGLKKFEADRGLPVTGVLDQKTLRALGVGSTSKSVPSAPTSSLASGLLRSGDFLINYAAESAFKGTITVTAHDSDCRTLSFAIDVTWAGGGGQDLPLEPFAVFYPGITFRFVGDSCIPAKGTEFDADNRSLSGTPMTDANIMLVGSGRKSLESDGPVNLTGSSVMDTSQGTAVVEFIASPDSPLVFQLTRDGYQYISGSGTVKLPDGKIYAFPPK